MAEITPPLQPLTDIFLLADRYDRRARMAPGFIVTLPLTVAAFFISEEFLNVFGALGIGFTVQLVSTVVLGNLSSVWGKKATDYRPTEKWLLGQDSKQPTKGQPATSPEHSQEQYKRWREAASAVSRIELESDAAGNPITDDENRLRAADISSQLNLRVVTQAPRSELLPGPMVRIHEEEYGFARNIYGLWPAWYLFTAMSLLLMAIAMFVKGGPFASGPGVFGMALELLMLLLAFLVRKNLDEYVETTARRYAKSLLNTAILMNEQPEPAEDPQRPGQ